VVVVHRAVLVVVVAHRVAVAVVVHKVVLVAVVAHRVAPVVDMESFGMEVALHTGWVAVAELPGLFHSSCKISGQG
jgi:hypothetical protein